MMKTSCLTFYVKAHRTAKKTNRFMDRPSHPRTYLGLFHRGQHDIIGKATVLAGGIFAGHILPSDIKIVMDNRGLEPRTNTARNPTQKPRNRRQVGNKTFGNSDLIPRCVFRAQDRGQSAEVDGQIVA